MLHFALFWPTLLKWSHTLDFFGVTIHQRLILDRGIWHQKVIPFLVFDRIGAFRLVLQIDLFWLWEKAGLPGPTQTLGENTQTPHRKAPGRPSSCEVIVLTTAPQYIVSVHSTVGQCHDCFCHRSANTCNSSSEGMSPSCLAEFFHKWNVEFRVQQMDNALLSFDKASSEVFIPTSRRIIHYSPPLYAISLCVSSKGSAAVATAATVAALPSCSRCLLTQWEDKKGSVQTSSFAGYIYFFSARPLLWPEPRS